MSLLVRAAIILTARGFRAVGEVINPKPPTPTTTVQRFLGAQSGLRKMGVTP